MDISPGSNYVHHDCDEGYIAKNAVDLDIFLTVFLVHVVKIFSVTSKVYNKLRYQTDNWSGDEKLCCNVSFSPGIIRLPSFLMENSFP